MEEVIKSISESFPVINGIGILYIIEHIIAIIAFIIFFIWFCKKFFKDK